MTFAEELELEAFPFDVQDFTISIQATRNTSKMDMEIPFFFLCAYIFEELELESVVGETRFEKFCFKLWLLHCKRLSEIQPVAII